MDNSPKDLAEDKTATPPSGEIETPSEETFPESEEIQGEEVNKKSAESRIDELIARNKSLEEKLDSVLQERTTVPPAPAEPVSPDLEKAKEFLRTNLNVVTREDLENLKQSLRDEQIVQSEDARLSELYSGEDGRPKYDPLKVKEYGKVNGIYNLEAAYEQLNKAELADWAIRKAEEGMKQRPYVEKGGSSTANKNQNTITREKLQEVVANMSDPKNREWYEKNRDKVLELYRQGAL